MLRNHWGGLESGLSSSLWAYRPPWSALNTHCMFSLHQKEQQQDGLRGALSWNSVASWLEHIVVTYTLQSPRKKEVNTELLERRHGITISNKGFVTTDCYWHLTLRRRLGVMSHIYMTKYVPVMKQGGTCAASQWEICWLEVGWCYRNSLLFSACFQERRWMEAVSSPGELSWQANPA